MVGIFDGCRGVPRRTIGTNGSAGEIDEAFVPDGSAGRHDVGWASRTRPSSPLMRLKELLNAGAISPAELDTEKEKILGS